jgi:hypothetical protein
LSTLQERIEAERTCIFEAQGIVRAAVRMLRDTTGDEDTICDLQYALGGVDRLLTDVAERLEVTLRWLARPAAR